MNRLYDGNTVAVKMLFITDESGEFLLNSEKCQSLEINPYNITKISCNNLSCGDVKIASEALLLLFTCCTVASYFEFNDNILSERLPNGEPNEDVSDFFALIKDRISENIQHLDFSESTLFSVINLNAILNKLPLLRSLNLSKTNIIQLLSSVSTSLSSSNKISINIPISIRELIISDVKMQDYHLECFIHNSFDYLENLDLSNNRISKGIEAITQYSFHSLTTLSLANNEIPSESGEIIGQWIINSKQLKVIDFSGNNLSDKGVIDITTKIKKLSLMQQMYFSRNGIGDEGFLALIKNCSCLKDLVHLNVSENNIEMDFDQKKSTTNAFKRVSIKILSIYGNPIKDIHRACDEYLKCMTNLEELRIK